MNNPQPPNNQDDCQAQLASMRQRIDAIDRQLLSLLSERQQEVEQVVALKKEHNLPVYHPAREEDLISDRRSKAQTHGLDEQFIEDIFRAIIRRSRITQTHTIATKGVRVGAKVVVVGGRGKMGRFFEQWFARSGYQTHVLDQDDWPQADTILAQAELALVCTPIDDTEAIVDRLGPRLPPDCILADITSIKGRIVKAMCRAHIGPVLGMHPLFGPAVGSMDKQLVIATPGRQLDRCQWVMDQFTAWGNVVIQSDPDKHDRNMTNIQALRHFATFAFGRFLYKRQVDLQDTLEFSSPIYRLELGMVGRMFAQDPELYAAIIFALPERRALLKEYITALQENLTLLDHGSEEQFTQTFKEVSDWFGPFADQAMRESSYLIDKLIERF